MFRGEAEHLAVLRDRIADLAGFGECVGPALLNRKVGRNEWVLVYTAAPGEFNDLSIMLQGGLFTVQDGTVPEGHSDADQLYRRYLWIVLDDDSTVPALTDRTRTLSLAGVPAQWAFPAADTLVGMKVAARGFLRKVERCRTR